MVDLVVVGSVAIDSIQTPFGKREKILGGSACYFSYIASFFCKVGLIGIIGRDFPMEYLQPLESRGVDLSGLVKDQNRDSFFWQGKYEGDMNTAETVEVRLNVLGDYIPVIPEEYSSAGSFFLANSHPDTQLAVLDNLQDSPLVCCDSMNLWINNNLPSLMKVLQRVNGFFCNDGEVKLITQGSNTIVSGNELAGVIDGFLTVKKGEHGAVLFSPNGFIALPAFPTEKVVDPTGAGDSFAGGFMGSLVKSGSVTHQSLKKAMLDGTVMASFTVEGFGLEGLVGLTDKKVEKRRADILDMLPRIE